MSIWPRERVRRHSNPWDVRAPLASLGTSRALDHCIKKGSPPQIVRFVREIAAATRHAPRFNYISIPVARPGVGPTPGASRRATMGGISMKRELIRQLQAELGRELLVLKQAALASREAATHEEARPENDKDTRAIEAAYLAGAQADRVRELERTVNALEFLPLRAFGPADPILAAALVEVDLDGERLHYFIAPQGGGLQANLDGKRILVITPQSPIGVALLGKTAGDVVEVQTKNGLREYEIVRVS